MEALSSKIKVKESQDQSSGVGKLKLKIDIVVTVFNHKKAKIEALQDEIATKNERAKIMRIIAEK